jgi:hypothetical protein
MESGFLVQRAGAGRRGKEDRKIAEKRAKTASFDDGSKNRAATPVETTSDGRGRRRPTRRRDRRRSGPVGRKAGVEKRREKVEKSTIRGQRSEPSADRSPSTESDETRPSNGATRRPPGRKIWPRSEERFGRRGRRRGTTRRARRQKDQSTRAARRRTRRRRGTDARNKRQYGERRLGGTEQKKKSRKSAKAFESYRRFGERLKAGSFEDVRPHAGDDGHAQRHRATAVVAAASDGGGAVGRASDYGAGGCRFDSADGLFFFLQSRFETKAKSRKRIDNHSQPLPSVDSSTVHKTKYAPCGHKRESGIATRGSGRCTTTKTSRKIKPEMASSAV